MRSCIYDSAGAESDFEPPELNLQLPLCPKHNRPRESDRLRGGVFEDQLTSGGVYVPIVIDFQSFDATAFGGDFRGGQG